MKPADFFSHAELAQLKKQSSVLLVSGGPDSVYLFHLFCLLKAKYQVQFSVLHFHHHLRGTDSDADAQLVRDLCRQLQVSCKVLHHQFRSKTSLPARARRWRYVRAYEYMRKLGAGYLFTAHHADDQLETLILRAQRGAGAYGMAGIWRKRTLTLGYRPKSSPRRLSQKITLWRPLLNMSKQQIVSWLTTKKKLFRIDASNAQSCYERNRVRAQISQSQISVASYRQMQKHSDRLAWLADYQDKRIRELQRLYDSFVPRAVWQNLTSHLKFAFFVFRLKFLGFAKQVTTALYQEFCQKRILQTTTIFMAEYPSGFYSRHIRSAGGATDQMLKAPGAWFFGSRQMRLCLSLQSYHEWLANKQKSTKSDFDLAVSSTAVEWPLQLTLPQPGDVFWAYSWRRAKSIKYLLQDQKIPIEQRATWPVLKTPQGQMVAVCGLEVAKPAQVHPGAPVLCIKFRHTIERRASAK